MNQDGSKWFQVLDLFIRRLVTVVCSVMLLLMVAFMIYTVIKRYVFLDPPFWADTVALFANIWFVMLAYSLAVRDREHIAMQVFYTMISPRTAFCMDVLWSFVTLLFGAFLIWYGWEAASRVPGQFWELGGFPKRYAVAIMPLAGVLIVLAASARLALDIRALRHGRIEDQNAASVLGGGPAEDEHIAGP